MGILFLKRDAAAASPMTAGRRTCLQVVDPFEVDDEKVSWDDDGGVAQDVEEKAEHPDVLPAFQEGCVSSIGGHTHTHTKQHSRTQTGNTHTVQISHTHCSTTHYFVC